MLPTPWTEDQIQPDLVVYRRGKPCINIPYTNTAESVTEALQKLEHGGMLATYRVAFIVHGFLNDIDAQWMQEMKDALLTESDMTVALVGWGGGADLFITEYTQAAANCQTVGLWLAKYVEAIKKLVPNTWGIGHSLGAHVLGTAGRTSDALIRITGLDPAGPSFEEVNQDKRLRSTDASDMVDIIHTDGYESKLDPVEWFSPINHYGTLIPLGTVDFYPNYGIKQPGAGTFEIAGSHKRAHDLFTWSIANPGKFRTNLLLKSSPTFENPVEETYAIQNHAEMGYYADAGSNLNKGNFYIATNSSPPWAP